MRDVRVSRAGGAEPSTDPRSRSTFGLWRYAFALASPVFFGGGIYTAVTDDVLLGIGLCAMGIGFGAIFVAESVPLEHSGPTAELLELGGGPRHAFVFRSSRARLTWFALAAVCGLVLGVLGFVLAPELMEAGEDPMLLRIAAGMIGVVCAASVLGLLRARNESFIALTPEGLWARGFLGTIHVRWEAITGTGLFEIPGPRGTRQVSVGVGVRDPSDIETRKVLGVLSGFDRASYGWDLSFSVTTMGSDPGILVEGVDWYRRDPDARKGIGRSEDLEMLRKIAG